MCSVLCSRGVVFSTLVPFVSGSPYSLPHHDLVCSLLLFLQLPPLLPPVTSSVASSDVTMVLAIATGLRAAVRTLHVLLPSTVMECRASPLIRVVMALPISTVDCVLLCLCVHTRHLVTTSLIRWMPCWPCCFSYHQALCHVLHVFFLVDSSCVTIHRHVPSPIWLLSP